MASSGFNEMSLTTLNFSKYSGSILGSLKYERHYITEDKLRDSQCETIILNELVGSVNHNAEPRYLEIHDSLGGDPFIHNV